MILNTINLTMSYCNRTPKIFCVLIFLFSILIGKSFAQSNIDDVLQKKYLFYGEAKFQLYEFRAKQNGKEEGKIKIKYLVKDAYQKFVELNKNKKILLVTAASFTSAFFNNGTPIGICAYEGEFLNKMPNQTMDGLVVINPNGLFDINYVSDLDIVKKECGNLTCNHRFHLNPRENVLDSYYFYDWIQKEKLSVFQTQLVYSHLKTKDENFKNLSVGVNSKRRRFLVLAKKDNELRNIIVNSEKHDYVMKASKDVYEMLTDNGYVVDFILNLDTGSKNLLHVHNGKYLENLRPNTTTKLARIERASNLIVFYTENNTTYNEDTIN